MASSPWWRPLRSKVKARLSRQVSSVAATSARKPASNGCMPCHANTVNSTISAARPRAPTPRNRSGRGILAISARRRDGATASFVWRVFCGKPGSTFPENASPSKQHAELPTLILWTCPVSVRTAFVAAAPAATRHFHRRNRLNPALSDRRNFANSDTVKQIESVPPQCAGDDGGAHHPGAAQQWRGGLLQGRLCDGRARRRARGRLSDLFAAAVRPGRLPHRPRFREHLARRATRAHRRSRRLFRARRLQWAAGGAIRPELSAAHLVLSAAVSAVHVAVRPAAVHPRLRALHADRADHL